VSLPGHPPGFCRHVVVDTYLLSKLEGLRRGC